MKPFDIKLAKQGKPVCTRDGKPVRILCYDRASFKPISAIVQYDDGVKKIYSYRVDGTRFDNNDELDLFMVGEKKEGYVNIYKEFSRDHVFTSPVYKTLDEANRAIDMSDIFLGTSKIEWEE